MEKPAETYGKRSYSSECTTCSKMSTFNWYPKVSQTPFSTTTSTPSDSTTSNLFSKVNQQVSSSITPSSETESKKIRIASEGTPTKTKPTASEKKEKSSKKNALIESLHGALLSQASEIAELKQKMATSELRKARNKKSRKNRESDKQSAAITLLTAQLSEVMRSNNSLAEEVKMLRSSAPNIDTRKPRGNNNTFCDPLYGVVQAEQVEAQCRFHEETLWKALSTIKDPLGMLAAVQKYVASMKVMSNKYNVRIEQNNGNSSDLAHRTVSAMQQHELGKADLQLFLIELDSIPSLVPRDNVCGLFTVKSAINEKIQRCRTLLLKAEYRLNGKSPAPAVGLPPRLAIQQLPSQAQCVAAPFSPVAEVAKRLYNKHVTPEQYTAETPNIHSAPRRLGLVTPSKLGGSAPVSQLKPDVEAVLQELSLEHIGILLDSNDILDLDTLRACSKKELIKIGFSLGQATALLNKVRPIPTIAATAPEAITKESFTRPKPSVPVPVPSTPPAIKTDSKDTSDPFGKKPSEPKNEFGASGGFNLDSKKDDKPAFGLKNETNDTKSFNTISSFTVKDSKNDTFNTLGGDSKNSFTGIGFQTKDDKQTDDKNDFGFPSKLGEKKDDTKETFGFNKPSDEKKDAFSADFGKKTIGFKSDDFTTASEDFGFKKDTFGHNKEDNKDSFGFNKSDEKKDAFGLDKGDEKKDAFGFNKDEKNTFSLNKQDEKKDAFDFNKSDEKKDAFGLDKGDEKKDAFGFNKDEKNTFSLNKQDEKKDAFDFNKSDEKKDAFGLDKGDEKKDAFGFNKSDEKKDAFGLDKGDEKKDAFGFNKDEKNTFSLNKQDEKKDPFKPNKEEEKKDTFAIGKDIFGSKNDTFGFNKDDEKKDFFGVNKDDKKDTLGTDKSEEKKDAFGFDKKTPFEIKSDESKSFTLDKKNPFSLGKDDGKDTTPEKKVAGKELSFTGLPIPESKGKATIGGFTKSADPTKKGFPDTSLSTTPAADKLSDSKFKSDGPFAFGDGKKEPATVGAIKEQPFGSFLGKLDKEKDDSETAKAVERPNAGIAGIAKDIIPMMPTQKTTDDDVITPKPLEREANPERESVPFSGFTPGKSPALPEVDSPSPAATQFQKSDITGHEPMSFTADNPPPAPEPAPATVPGRNPFSATAGMPGLGNGLATNPSQPNPFSTSGGVQQQPQQQQQQQQANPFGNNAGNPFAGGMPQQQSQQPQQKANPFSGGGDPFNQNQPAAATPSPAAGGSGGNPFSGSANSGNPFNSGATNPFSNAPQTYQNSGGFSDAASQQSRQGFFAAAPQQNDNPFAGGGGPAPFSGSGGTQSGFQSYSNQGGQSGFAQAASSGSAGGNPFSSGFSAQAGFGSGFGAPRK
eukprot:TRINITY_DN293_c0_g2_i1.p1 TRINITY_DN293_c0_g2~~TRINITY_DN293_c0_g2_i1.p1  ORF type:complete len:1479 (+),score=418.64 TRINITY_DN293_c0_g2_i1:346-4437(+)